MIASRGWTTHRIRRLGAILLYGIFLALTACQPGNPTAPQTAAYPIDEQESEKNLMIPLPPSDAPVPVSGMSSLSGALFSYTIQRLIPETMGYLTPAEGVNHDSVPVFLAGPDPARGDVVFHSDPIGNFTLADVPPGNYYLIVSAPYNWSLAETSPNDPTPMLIRLGGGDRLALGVVYFSWP